VAPPLVIENWNLQTTTTYYASYRLSACEGQRVPVAARVHPIPSAPQPLTFEFCSFSQQVLNLRGLANGLGWLIYDTQTSHSPLRQATSSEATFTFAFNRSTTLWAAAYDLVTGCQSPRSQLSVNLLPPPEPPAASDVSFCAQASQNIVFFAGANQRVELKETPGGSVIRTYAAGACAQGCTFTTPVLSQSTTYYLEAIDIRNGCRSAAKEVKVISQAPAPPQVQPIPICAQGGFVTFSYSLEQTGANQIRLYRSVGNILVNTANQPQGLLRGPYVTTNTAFLISGYNTQTQCESPRLLYTIPVRAPLPLPIAGRVTRCPNQSATLTLTIPEELSGIRLEVYATQTAGTPIFTTIQLQDSFILPPSSVNDTVYLVYRDPATGCVSAQQPLEVVITPPPPAPNNQTIIACGSQLITVRALPSGAVVPEFAEYRLYTQAAGIEPILVSSVPPYDITLRTERNVTYYFAGRDLQTGCESQRAVIRLQRNNPPAPPVALQSPILLCRPGPVTISAAFSGPVAQGIRLYTTPEDGDFIASRAEAPYHFVLPNVTATTTFYLESWNTGFICNTSQRAPVVVRVDPGLEPAAPSVSAPVRFCAGAAAQFTALPGDNSTRAILLYTSARGAEAAQIRREEPFVFSLEQIRRDSVVYLEAANDVCSSRRRTPVLLTPFAKPPVPQAQAVERCGPGKVIFTITNAQAGVTAELWDMQNRLVATSQEGSSFIEVPYLAESATFNVRFNNNGCQGEFVQVRALIKNCSPLQCPSPSKPSLVSAAANRATVAWMPAEGASRYRVTYRQTGAETQQSATTADNQITLEGLLPGKTYEFSIQAECIQDGVLTSSAPVPFSFETPLERRIQGLANASDFKFYPNPGKGFFFLEAINPDKGQTPELSLWDMLGNWVWRASWSPSSTEPVLGIDWSHLPPASYILKVYYGKEARVYPVLITR
jgi:chitodextrinase